MNSGHFRNLKDQNYQFIKTNAILAKNCFVVDINSDSFPTSFKPRPLESKIQNVVRGVDKLKHCGEKIIESNL